MLGVRWSRFWYPLAILIAMFSAHAVGMQGRPPHDDTELLLRASELFSDGEGNWLLPVDAPPPEEDYFPNDKDKQLIEERGWATHAVQFSGAEFRRMTARPLVYMFIKGDECTYVGMSRKGIHRPLSRNHKQRQARREADLVKIVYCKDVKSAFELEAYLIRRLQPDCNKAGLALIARNRGQFAPNNDAGKL